MKLIAPFVFATVLALAAEPAAAEWPVFDASNFAQNVLTAARTLRTVENQILQIQQSVQMLENEARNLASLTISDLLNLNNGLTDIQQLMAEAQGIIYDVNQAEQQFKQLFPQNYSLSVSADQIVQDARARWATTVQAFDQSVRTQSRIVADIASDQRIMTQAVTASQGAVGILQAVQATNQLLALQVKQAAALQAMLAAHGRAQDLDQARQAEVDETARVQRQQFLGDGVHYTPQAVQVFR